MEDLCNNPLDDILFRLPLKSVVTCKSISKRFNTFISDPGFEAKLFLRYSCIFHCAHDWAEFYFKVPLYPPNSNKETESSVTLPRCFKLLAYCSGLLLLRLLKKSFLVLNPVTKRYQFIENKNCVVIGLAVEPISSSLHYYKVVCIRKLPRDDTYQFDIISSDILSWRKSSTKFTSMSCNFSDALPIYAHGSLHWIRKRNDILVFHLKKEEARIIKFHQNLPLLFENWTSWFGVVNALLTIISTSREEISVWILNDYKKVEWVLKTRITNILNSEWPIRIPSFYDGERLVMHQRKLGQHGEVWMYDIAPDK
ncbi:F-box protein At1g20360-like [Castanea sativa]|uniref:F-box protein At1g20360-like n=1 Tax=Castanea sativa TaxID=21020 RepID=UPI003F651B0A